MEWHLGAHVWLGCVAQLLCGIGCVPVAAKIEQQKVDNREVADLRVMPSSRRKRSPAPQEVDHQPSRPLTTQCPMIASQNRVMRLRFTFRCDASVSHDISLYDNLVYINSHPPHECLGCLRSNVGVVMGLGTLSTCDMSHDMCNVALKRPF